MLPRFGQDTVVLPTIWSREADEALEVQKDMQHLRAWRESVATVKRQSLMTAIGIITAGLLGLVWLAVKGTP